MDDDGLSIPNWGYYEPCPKGNFSLNLMPAMGNRDMKPFLPLRENAVIANPNVPFQPPGCIVSEPPAVHVDYLRDSWMNHREKYFPMIPGNPGFAYLPEPSAVAHVMPNFLLPSTLNGPSAPVEDPGIRKQSSDPIKKRSASPTPKPPKAKKPKKVPSVPKENGNSSAHRPKAAKRNIDVVINGIDMDISDIPIPVCSCTGSPQQCYRWGCGGWQSACCTTTISMYPLPMSTKRCGARIAGRKMSQGAFKKVLEKLVAEGYNFGCPINLRTHWAKHGTNKFVTIK